MLEQAQATRPVLRIFISSTAVDLRDYREKVRDAVLRLEGLPIAMETFSAQSGQPASECMRMAAEADAVICIVAHRYGYVPPKELGGDGERSITWLEVDAAKKAGKPVFVFLVNPNVPWAGGKEQDRLTSEPEKAVEIAKAVQKLQEFRALLERDSTRNIFSNDEELAKLAAITVAGFNRQSSHASVSTTRAWQPLFCHALQPAQHFRGRETKLQELKDWLQAPVTPDRVVSVVAAGGTGKTALVDKALHEATFSGRAGVFVWSFYEDPRTDEFLRAAYLYFTGKDAPTGGMLERLQLELSGDLPHILVMDGLERVQSESGHHRLGQLEDLQLRRLVKALAGGIGGARALLTSRFPLADLDEMVGAGHRAIELDDLERPAALGLLRACGVKGEDTALRHLLEPLDIDGCYHALSVAVLGSYLGHFAKGDPRQAPKFALEDATVADAKARRLSRILEGYAKALTAAERDLLGYLSLFPNGVEVKVLEWVSQPSRWSLRAIVLRQSAQKLRKHLERLRKLGLVFRSDGERKVVYSAHPFLRDFFRTLLGVTPESVHESVRAKLAPSLEDRPGTYPKSPMILDAYEQVIGETLLAGRVQEAFDLYSLRLGCHRHLVGLGESTRGLRILEQFVPQDNFDLIRGRLADRDFAHSISDLGLFALQFGDIARARAAFAYARLSRSKAKTTLGGLAITESHHAGLELRAGNFPKALEYSGKAVAIAIEGDIKDNLPHYLSNRAWSLDALGDIAAAASDYQQISDQGNIRACDAGFRFRRGDRLGALSQAKLSLEAAQAENSDLEVCIANITLAGMLVQDDPVKANELLDEARAFAGRSGSVNLELHCYYTACKLRAHLGDYPQAIAEAEAGIFLADTCGFGKFSIDLRLALAETLLAAGDAHKALQRARQALDRSEHPDCQYAWGKADGLHFCGLAHLRLGERELARQRLTAALELRARLGHGRIEETRKALAQLGA